MFMLMDVTNSNDTILEKKYFIQPITQPDVLDSFLLWAWKRVADIVAKETNNMFFVYVITLFQIRWNSKLS